MTTPPLTRETCPPRYVPNHSRNANGNSLNVFCCGIAGGTVSGLGLLPAGVDPNPRYKPRA